MTRTNTPGGEAARRPPRPITRGDVVTLKADETRERYVVAGFLYGPGFRFLVRRAAGYQDQEHLVTRCEIATVERTPAEPDGQPAPAADPYPGGEPAAAHGAVEWEDPDAGDNVASAGGRFEVRQVGGQYVATDWHEFQISLPFPLRADAVAWCERQAEESAVRPDAGDNVAKPAVAWEAFDERGHQWSRCRRFQVTLWSGTLPIDRSEYEACDFGPDGHGEVVATRHDSAEAARRWCEGRAVGIVPTLADVPLVDVPGLEWHGAGAGMLVSACGRFKITPRLDDLGVRKEGAYLAVDARCDDPGLRFSPDCGLDDAKEWCEERSQFDVVRGYGGAETLVPEVPF
jgi:hypothetical protein